MGCVLSKYLTEKRKNKIYPEPEIFNNTKVLNLKTFNNLSKPLKTIKIIVKDEKMIYEEKIKNIYYIEYFKKNPYERRYENRNYSPFETKRRQ